MLSSLNPPLKRSLKRSLKRPISRDKSDTLLLIFTCALVLAPHSVHLPLWITMVCIGMLGWRGWIAFRGNRLPPRWILLPIALMIVPGIYWSYRFFGRNAGVAMLVMLLTCKLLEMRGKRDLFVIVCLSFFLMLTNLFFSQSIGTALLMVVTTVAILATQLSFQYTGLVPPLKQRFKIATFIVGLALPLTMILFLLFPRIQGPLWGMQTNSASGQTGMSETMAPGNIATLALSDDIAFRARFYDIVPGRSSLYWRGVVLGNYDGRTWSKLRQEAVADAFSAIVPRSTAVRYQVTMEASNQRWLYALDLPRSLPVLRDNSVGLTEDQQLIVANPVTERTRYEIESSTSYVLEQNSPQLALQDWLELPPGFNPLTHAYAARLRNQTDDNAALVQTVLGFFRTGSFRYTLEPPLLGVNSVDDFLFNTRAGFCEHYASAFVVLMRALDIPSRVVTGYQGGELNPADHFMTVRQSDAHAWAEVWLKGRGWVRIDPTAAVAPERIELNFNPRTSRSGFGGLNRFDPRSNSWVAGLKLRLDAMNNGWNQWVLNYNPQRQKSLVESIGLGQVDWATLTLLAFGFGAAVMGVIALALLWKREKIDPLSRLYRKMCDCLTRFDVPPLQHEGPRTYAGRLMNPDNAIPPGKRQVASRFMMLYEEQRYAPKAGRRTANERTDPIHKLKKLLVEMR